MLEDDGELDEEIETVPERGAPLLEKTVDDVVLLAETEDPLVGLTMVPPGDEEGAVTAPPVLAEDVYVL